MTDPTHDALREALEDAEDMLALIIDDWGGGHTVCEATKKMAISERERIQAALSTSPSVAEEPE